MYYWNQDNFEGLNDIAEEFSKKQGYEHFSRYCLLREKGLKKSAFVERALAIDPSDEISLNRIIMYELGYVDFATHHLSESIFLGDEAISEVALAKANAYMIRLPDSDSKAEHQADINYFRSLLDAWRAYQASNKQKTFPEWSGEKGYKFSFSIIYYYGK
jgi:hypothetical protein